MSSIVQITSGSRPTCAYIPEADGEELPVIYMLAGPDPALELSGALDKAGALRGRAFAAVAVGTTSWNGDYSPWPAEPVVKGEPPFTGGAGALLRWLTEDLIPFTESSFSQLRRPRSRMLLGYSLAGLTALYAMYVTDSFAACGCCSGSLWYPGWVDYMASHRMRAGKRVYLSLGRGEEKSKNPRLAAVGGAARAAHDLLSGAGNADETTLVWHDGGHFAAIPDRMGKAMTWLLR